MDDPVVRALDGLVPGGVRRGELRRGSRVLRWVEAGSGGPAVVLDASLGQPGSLAWAGVLPSVAARTRVIAYDRAGTGMSEPALPLTLDGQVGDVTALIESTGERCVLAGHSWGGLLAQLAARKHPALFAGLVLVDPADERFRASLSPVDTFRPFARRLSADPRLQSLILDAYAACYAERSQAQMVQDENRLFAGSVPVLRQARVSAALPEVAVTILSATTGMPEGQRDSLTGFHAELAATAPGSRHVVLPDTGHLIPQVRPEPVAEAINLVIEEARQAGNR